MKKNTEQEAAGNGWIDKNGVLFLMRGDACMDIQVKPQVEEVDFGDMEHIYLKNLDNETPFPNVKRLKISGDGIKTIQISNTMFPNVREIISTNPKYPSGSMLIEKAGNNMHLLNAFCLNEDEPLDLSGIVAIRDDALVGCKSDKVINTEDVIWVSTDAFKASSMACMKKPFVDGVRMVGSIACDFDADAKKYIIPEDATTMATFYDFNRDATMIINRNCSFFANTPYSPPNHLVFTNTDHMDEQDLRYLKKYDAEIRNNHPEYTIIDDVVYTKDMSRVVACFERKAGDIVIEDGVREIARSAFSNCYSINSVWLPDSVEKIDEFAFNDCVNLCSMHFGKNVKQIGRSCFRGDKHLTKTELPGTIKELTSYSFAYCITLDSLKINEGTQSIHPDAFFGTYIEKLFIPSSLKSFRELGAGEIRTQEIVLATEDIPEDVFINTTATKIITPSRVIWLPLRELMTQPAKWKVNHLVNSQRNGEIEPLYKFCGGDVQYKRYFAFHAYAISQQEETKAYLKRVGKNLAENLIKEGKEDDLAKLMQYDILSINVLKQIQKALEKTDCERFAVAKAYILDKVGQTKSKNKLTL